MTDFIYSFIVFFVRIIMAGVFSLKYDGRHYLNRQTGPVILAGNHTGWLDSFIVASASSRRVRFLVVDWVFKIPFIGFMVTILGGIPVKSNRGSDAIETAQKYLARGDSICIFPEGRLTEDGNIAKFHKGVAKLHQLSKCPIVPFAIYGGFEAWGYNQRFPKPHKIVIHFGVPFTRLDLPSNEEINELSQIIGSMKEAITRQETTNQEYLDGVLGLTQSRSDMFAARPAVCMKINDTFLEISFNELSRRASRLASYFIETGFKHGSRIAILSESRPEFAIAFFSAVRAGAIVVPLDTKLTSRELKTLINDCEPEIIMVSNHCLKNIEAIKDDIASVKNIYTIDLTSDQASTFTSIHDLKPAQNHPSINRDLNETALIIYTSGTTGNPKGVMTSFSNIVFQIQRFQEILSTNQSFSFLSILPLNHLLELTHGFLGVLHAGGTVYYSSSLYPKDIISLMKERSIYGMFSVPLFYKTLKIGIEKEIHKGGSLANLWWQTASNLAKLIPSKSIRRLLFYPLQQKLGGNLQMLISGGAALDVSIGKFYDLIGIPLLQGYGLTETSPVITFNTPAQNKLGSVGRPFTGIEVKIAKKAIDDDSGEILTRGPHIMQGYYKRPDLTKEAIDSDGWFHTGDVGKIDQDGYLYITGRLKNLIVLAGGKKIHPEEVEGVISNCQSVKEVCVLGLCDSSGNKKDQEQVVAVVTPSDNFKSMHANHNGNADKELIKLVEKEYVNLASYKQPTRIIVLDEELPKTAIRKVKRNDLINLLKSKSLI